MIRRLFGLVAAVWTAIFAPLAWASNGLMPTSNGPVQNGRGGVDIAIADSPLSMFTNPAGITRFDFLTSASALGIYIPKQTYTDPENEDRSSVSDLYPIPNFAIVFDQDFFNSTPAAISDSGAKYFSDDDMRNFVDDLQKMRHKRDEPHWTFGIGVFVKGGAGNHMNLRSRLFPDDATYYSNFALLSLTPTLAYQFSRKVSIGIGLDLNYSTIKLNTLVGQDPNLMKQVFDFSPFFGLPFGTLTTKFAELFTQIHDPNSSNLLVTLADAFGNQSPKDGARNLSGRFVLEKASAFGLGGRIGVMVEPEDWLSIGASYSTRTFMSRYRGKARIDFTREIDSLGLILGPLTRGLLGVFSNPIETDVLKPIVGNYDAEVVDFNFPAVTSVGMAIHPPDSDWLMGVDVKYIQWAEVYKSFNIRLTHGDNRLLNTAIGSDQDSTLFGPIAKEPSSSITTSLPLNLKNQWVFAIGGEYRLRPDLTVRAGYSYVTELSPDNTYMPILPGIVQHHLTMGFSYEVFKNTVMDMSWEHGFEAELNTKRHSSADDLDNSHNTVEHDTIWTGVTVRY